MADPPRKIHDALFQAAIAGDIDAVRSQVQALLPTEFLASLDLAKLQPEPGTFVDPELRGSQSDCLYSVQVKGREALIYVLYEHQSTPDPLMAFRLLSYLVRVWDWWLRNEKKAPKSLPAILPLVVYHGERAWDVPTSFLDLIDLPPEDLASVRSHLPDFQFVLDDLSQRTEEELLARNAPPMASISLVLFKYSRTGQDLFQILRAHRAMLEKLAQEPEGTLRVAQVVSYTFYAGNAPRAELAEFAGEVAGPEAKEGVMTTAERLIQEGRREALLRLLRRKFGRDLPSEIEDRVNKAGVTDLDSWLDQILVAETLDEVFAPPQG